VKIAKLSGAGNDFVVIGADEARALGDGLESWVRRVCRRGLSVGADGVVVVEPSGERRVRMRFLNPDGGEAFCGNGSRCAARYAHLRGWVGNAPFVLDARVGEIEAQVSGQTVRLVLPPPRDLGVAALEIGGTRVEGRSIDSGVPHFVVSVADVSSAPLAHWGPTLRRHPRFGAEGTNVDVVSVNQDAAHVRTWERGVEGETLSCGTGAVAAAHVARIAGAGECVRVMPASGVALTVALPGPPHAPRCAVVEGDARLVFEATLAPESTEGFPD
jgi:diaminopimelate epimerase